MATGRKRKPTLRELARQEPTAAEREALEDLLESIPGATLRPEDLARLLALWHGEYTPMRQRKQARAILARYDLNEVVDITNPARPRATNETPAARREPSKRQHGNRFTDDEIFDAVARAMADGVKSLGRSPGEAHRPAMGYGAWRGYDEALPSVRTIRDGFKPTGDRKPRPGWKLRKGEDAWAAVVRLGRKAGRIPPK